MVSAFLKSLNVIAQPGSVLGIYRPWDVICFNEDCPCICESLLSPSPHPASVSHPGLCSPSMLCHQCYPRAPLLPLGYPRSTPVLPRAAAVVSVKQH